MKVLDKLYRELMLEGRQASKLEPDEQAEVIQNVRERLQALAQEMLSKLEIVGSSLKKELERITMELQEIGGGVSHTAHVQSICLGVFYLGLTLLIILGEFWLMAWTLKPFSQSIERMVIAATIVVIGMVGIERYFSQIQRVKPQSYQKYVLNMIVIALVGLIAAGLLLALVRGEYLGAQGGEQSLTGKVETAQRFYGRTAFLPFVMGILAVSLALMSGVALHEGLGRTITSGSYLGLAKRRRLFNEELKITAVGMREWEAVETRGFGEFMKGLQEGRAERRVIEEKSASRENKGSFSPSPWFILIMSIILVLLILSLARAEGLESVILLIDTSRSSLCKGYEGETEFRENILFVPEVIEKLNPGTLFRVIGITGESFGKAYILIKGEKLPMEEGSFGENLASAKLSLIEKWEKLEIKPSSNETDIFGALYLAGIIFSGDPGEKKLVILSDMRNTTYVNLESPSSIDEKMLVNVEKAGLIPDLKGVKVWVMGVSSCGKDVKYWLSLKKFWEEFFTKSGASLLSFSMERRWE